MTRLTHLTFRVNNFEESIAFYGQWFGLVVHKDRRPKGTTVWMTTAEQHRKEKPDFIFVLEEGPLRLMHHIGFQTATREQLDALAAESKSAGIWVEGPVDQGGDIGSYVFVRDPNGHIWEYTWGQPFNGL
jgi:catechol 2,3-dioxygenase-like lactoylglutathione lyase family enzyme